MTEGGETFGRIIEDNPNEYLLDVDDAPLVLLKDRRAQREVKANSLDLLHLREPGAIVQRFADNPVETVVAVLADRPVDRTKDQIVDQLRRFGIDLDEKGWKGLQTKISGHPNIERRSSNPIRYRWREAMITREEPEVLLSRALAHSTPKDLAERARRELAALHAAFQLNPTQQALAALAEVPGVVLPRWSDVSIAGLEDRSVDLLLERAAQSRSWEFITPVALDPDHPAHAAHAAQLLANAPAGQREEQLAAALDRLANPPGGQPRSAERLVSLLPLLEQALGGDASPAIVASLLRLGLSLDATSPDAEGATAEAQRWATLTAARVSGSRQTMVEALVDVDPDPAEQAALAAVLADEPFDRDGARLRWLAALAQYEALTLSEDAESGLTGGEWWTGISLADLPILDADPDLGPRVRESLGRQLLVGLAVEGSLGEDPGALGQVLALPEWMLELVPVDAITSAADRLDPKAPLGRAVEAIRLLP
jgi:hypothetical protein